MFKFLVKKYIKSEDINDPIVREKYGILCGVVSILCNAFMAVFKLSVGFITHSVSIQADGYNNLSDMGSNLATMFGFKMANKHPDTEHPYGHGRYEYIAGLVIAFLILAVGFSSLKESFIKIIHPEVLNFQIVAVIVLIVSIVAKFWMGRFNGATSELIASPSLKAASQDSYNDVLMTVATLVSLLLSLVTAFPFDGIIGMIVSIFVLKSGIDIFKDTVNPLLGQAPDPTLVQEIYDFVLSYDKAKGIHDFMLHDYGPSRRYLSFHVEVNSHEDIMDIHDQIDLIEKDLLDKFHIFTTIHMDPIDFDDELTQNLAKEVTHYLKELNPLYSIHDFRIVCGKTHSNILFDIVVPNDDQITLNELYDYLDVKMNEKKKFYFFIIQIDHSFV